MNTYIDHTLLKPEATENQIKTLCKEAKTYNFASVCVHPDYVEIAKQQLNNSTVKVCTVIGFPLGANTTATKVFEAQDAIKNGADEIDMVINISWLKDKFYDKLESEITTIKKAIENHILKVIVEISLLTDDEIVKISQIVSNANADFIKTSTGFGTHGATLEAVQLMKANISSQVQIKASGGIRDYKTAKAYIDLGVTRLGTSSGVEIVKGKNSTKTY
ncbi:deoxyribose-phosphate aldolase [Flavobacterium sp. CS20]|uniref:deoxyribose-phosphate aldolase n=1 Tax=Flavobacterium sp. CS20 TaxID=2775246 RepID=UPI001B39EEDD|nr:deoxyribose-phosphate aldolase [Flavobacterium sp. CS20]QTY27364.1 deoxyribose-phosphate aldolase [Flavobacterium sp. CS20]